MNKECTSKTKGMKSPRCKQAAEFCKFGNKKSDPFHNFVEIAPEGARKIASKARGPTTTGIGGSFQLANSAPPLGVMGCASAPTARISQ